jgi:hypothetical protein
MVILKPIVILAFIPLLFFQQWKTIFAMMGFGSVFLIIPFIHKGWNEGINLWKEWLAAIGQHGDYIISENSFKYLSNYYFGIQSAWIPSIIGLMLLVVLFFITRQLKKLNALSFLEWSALFLAFTPNFFVTDTEHFLLSLPLILVVLRRLLLVKKALFWFTFVVLLLPFSLKSNDLMGKMISALANEAGWMGLANFALVLFFCFIGLSTNSKTNHTNLSVS